MEPSADMLERVAVVLADLRHAAKEGKGTGVSIGNTARLLPPDFAVTPLRSTDRLVVGSFLVTSVEQAVLVAKHCNGVVDYVLVDVEAKHVSLVGIHEAVASCVTRSHLLTFKGNDMTADAADALIAQIVGSLYGKRSLVAGAGNLGCKIALRLAERGSDVTILKRSVTDAQAIARGLSLTLPASGGRIIGASYETLQGDWAVVVGASSGVPVVTPEMVRGLLPGGGVVDAGIGAISPAAILECDKTGIPLVRVDIRAAFDGMVTRLLRTRQLVQVDLGRRCVDGVIMVSGGWIGATGAIVVDSVSQPGRVLGVSDGRGGVLPKAEEHVYADELARADYLIARMTMSSPTS